MLVDVGHCSCVGRRRGTFRRSVSVRRLLQSLFAPCPYFFFFSFFSSFLVLSVHFTTFHHLASFDYAALPSTVLGSFFFSILCPPPPARTPASSSFPAFPCRSWTFLDFPGLLTLPLFRLLHGLHPLVLRPHATASVRAPRAPRAAVRELPQDCQCFLELSSYVVGPCKHPVHLLHGSVS